MIADVETNKKLIVFKRKKSQYFACSYFKVPKTIRLSATHYFIMKIPKKRELQQIVSNHLHEIDFKDFIKLYKDYTKDHIYF